MSSLSKRDVARINKIKLLIFDVDGILTPGEILVHPDGSESKCFHVRDGIGIRLAMVAGIKVGLLSGRVSEAVAQRAQDLNLEICIQGSQDKKADLAALVEKAGLKLENAAYVGDDVVDLPALRIAGFAATVPDACPEAKEIAHYVTKVAGGRGAAREIVELILKSQNRWKDVIHHYLED